MGFVGFECVFWSEFGYNIGLAIAKIKASLNTQLQFSKPLFPKMPLLFGDWLCLWHWIS
jgi:hypothetical protein